jgi:hypothetical protein
VYIKATTDPNRAQFSWTDANEMKGSPFSTLAVTHFEPATGPGSRDYRDYGLVFAWVKERLVG